VADGVLLEASGAEAVVEVHHEEEEASRVGEAHQEEAQEEVSAQVRTGGLQELEDEASPAVAAAIKPLLYQYLHVAYAAFEEMPTRMCGLAMSRKKERSMILYQTNRDATRPSSPVHPCWA